MARTHHARRIARTSLIAGGVVAFALAAPSASSAQGPMPSELPSGNGLIAVSDASGKTTTIDSIGFNAKVLTGAPEGTVGWWSADNRLSFLSGMDLASFVDADVDFTTATPVAGLTPDAITGAAGSPRAVDMAIASDSGLVIVGEFGTENVSVNPAGRVAWTAEGTQGALIFDGRAAYEPESAGELPGAPASADQGTGIWRYDVETEQLVNLVSDPTAKNSSVSQDGNVIAYEHTTVNGDTDIHYVDRREPGMPPHALLGQSPMNEALPAVSPDGTKVAHYAEAGGPLVNVKGVAGDEYGDSVMFLDQEVTSIAWQPAAAADPGAPTISGEATVGTELTIAGTDATGTGPMTTELTWQRCAVAPPDSGDCTNVGSSAKYTLVEADLGHRIQVVRKVSNVLGEDSATSPLTAAVQPAGSGDPTPGDSTAPDPPSYTGYPALSDPDTTPTFSWVGSEPGGRFECQIVGGLKGAVIPPEAPPTTEWEACTSPFTTPELAEGLHHFRVRHFDDSSNVQGYDEYEWTVAAAPPAPDTDGPLQPTFTTTPSKRDNDPTPTFAWTGAEPGGTFQCRIESGLNDSAYGTWTDCASPFTTPELTDGSWTIGVRQVDDANNPGDPRFFEYELDTHAPDEVVLLETPMLNTPFPTATFKFAAPAAGDRMECRHTGPANESGDGWKPCASPVELPGLPNGKHTFEVREVDEAGNASVPGVWNWTVNAPAVEQPKPETPVKEDPKPDPKPETPKADTPVVQTPAVDPKQAESPKPATVVVPAPAAKPATAKIPALTAVIGGTKTGAQVGANGGTSSAATIEVAKEAVGVGCSITGTVLKSCKVDLYAPRASGATARAAAVEQVLVGTGTYEAKNGSSKMDVRIELNATGKAMLRANPGGLKVTVKISGQPVSGAPLKATGVAKLVTDRASLTVGGFAVNSAVLTSKARAQLRTLATFGKAASVRCVGHTDGSTDDESYLTGLGERRARAVCGYLARFGVKASKKTLVSKADSVPAATNTTKAGRAKNRRVQVTLVR